MECNSESFPSSVSFSKFPTNEYWQSLLDKYPNVTYKIFNMSLDDLYNKFNQGLITSEEINDILRDNVVALSVYYDEMSYTLIQELVKTELSDIISNVGGTLGIIFMILSLFSF